MASVSSFLPALHAVGSSGTIFIVLAVSAILFCAWVLSKSNKGSSQLPPGPHGLPVIGNLASLGPELHTYFTALAQEHGPILKLQLGQKLGIIVTSPSLAREVLKDNDLICANRDVPNVAPAVTYGGSDITWTPYGPEWRMLRKVCVVKMLSNTTLDSVYALRRHELRKTVGHLYSQMGSPVNLGEQIFLAIVNVITNMLWGGTVQGQERDKIGKDFRKVISDITELLGTPNLSDFFPKLAMFDFQGQRKKLANLAQNFDGIFEEMIRKRMELDKESDESKDFLQFLLKLEDEGDSKTPLTMTHVKALLMDMIVGGSDTSSNAIEFAMAEVLNKPEVMREAQKELDEVVGKDSIVEESHIHNLPYLYAIMKETLRLHPTLPLLVPHCPIETCTVGGYTVPKGARIFVNVWAIQRDPSIWENPHEFRPERFLDEKWDYSGRDFNYFPFGSGRRICAGIAMAERMFMYSLATLLHSFDWKIPQGHKLDLSEKYGIVMKLKTSLVAIPAPRLSDPKLYQ